MISTVPPSLLSELDVGDRAWRQSLSAVPVPAALAVTTEPKALHILQVRRIGMGLPAFEYVMQWSDGVARRWVRRGHGRPLATRLTVALQQEAAAAEALAGPGSLREHLHTQGWDEERIRVTTSAPQEANAPGGQRAQAAVDELMREMWKYAQCSSAHELGIMSSCASLTQRAQVTRWVPSGRQQLFLGSVVKTGERRPDGWPQRRAVSSLEPRNEEEALRVGSLRQELQTPVEAATRRRPMLTQSASWSTGKAKLASGALMSLSGWRRFSKTYSERTGRTTTAPRYLTTMAPRCLTRAQRTTRPLTARARLISGPRRPSSVNRCKRSTPRTWTRPCATGWRNTSWPPHAPCPTHNHTHNHTHTHTQHKLDVKNGVGCVRLCDGSDTTTRTARREALVTTYLSQPTPSMPTDYLLRVSSSPGSALSTFEGCGGADTTSCWRCTASSGAGAPILPDRPRHRATPRATTPARASATYS